MVQEAAHPDANIIFGANVDETLADQVWVTVIATRFDGRGRRADGSAARASCARPAPPPPSARRPADRRPGSAPSFESRPRDIVDRRAGVRSRPLAPPSTPRLSMAAARSPPAIR